MLKMNTDQQIRLTDRIADRGWRQPEGIRSVAHGGGLELTLLSAAHPADACIAYPQTTVDLSPPPMSHLCEPTSCPPRTCSVRGGSPRLWRLAPRSPAGASWSMQEHAGASALNSNSSTNNHRRASVSDAAARPSTCPAPRPAPRPALSCAPPLRPGPGASARKTFRVACG